MKTSMKKTTAVLSMGVLALGLASCGDSAADEPVELSEIEEAMWTSMEESESVTVTLNLPEVGGSDNGEQVDMMNEMFGTDFDEMSVYGAMDGSATGVDVSRDESEPLIRGFDDEVFLATSFLVTSSGSMVVDAEDEEAQAVLTELEEDYADTWMDYSAYTTDQMAGLAPAGLITELRDGWNAEGEGDDDDPIEGPMNANNLPAEGQPEERDGQDVWVFSGEEEDGPELVVEADIDAPRIVSANDGEVTLTFTDWDETESPERPSEDSIVDENELNERLMELF